MENLIGYLFKSVIKSKESMRQRVMVSLEFEAPWAHATFPLLNVTGLFVSGYDGR